MTEQTTQFMREYLRVIESHGSPAGRAIKPLEDLQSLLRLRDLTDVTPFGDLEAYFLSIDGYDGNALNELDLFDPIIAWDMSALSLDEAMTHYGDCAGCGESPDYWPHGFLPIMQDGSGSYLLVNCLRSSLTYGGVYEMTDCVGVNRISPSLREFFNSSMKEIAAGLRQYENTESTLCVEPAEYMKRAAPLFGHSPFFSRARMDEQIVDWK